MPGARPIVDPPSFTSLPFGLWDSIQHPTPPDHWQNGVTWIDRCPTGPETSTYDECISPVVTGAPPEPPPKTDNVDQRFRGATPVTVYARFDCSPVGMQDAQNAAVEALNRNEQAQLEYSFWTGLAAGQTVVFPHLAADAEFVDEQGILLQPDALELTASPVNPALGLGLLEWQLSQCYPGQGFIHISPLVLPVLAAWNLAIERDGALWTPRGNRIVVGSGYQVSGPDGSPPGPEAAWIYATGAMFGYRGEVRFTQEPESLNRATNTMGMIAERTYVLGWECCLVAALIDLDIPEV